MSEKELILVRHKISWLKARNTGGRNNRLISKYMRKLLKLGLEEN